MRRCINHIDSVCSLCNWFPKAMDHLLAQCEVTRLDWFGSPLGIRLEAEATLVGLFPTWLNRSNLMVCVRWTMAIIWAIWKSHNKIIFKRGQVDIKEMIELAGLYFKSYSFGDEGLARQVFEEIKESLPEANWCKPLVGEMKCNVDGIIVVRLGLDWEL